MKVIIKDSLNDVQGTLAEVEKRVHGTIAKKGAYSHIDAVANQSTLRPDLTSRNAANILESARFRALAENNTVLLHEINQFDKNYKTMDPNKRTQIFDTIKKVTGQEAVQYAQTKMGVGVSKTHTIAFGNAAIDLGSGGGGSISERNLINYTGLGMTNYTKEVNNSRINKGTTAALLDVNKTQTSINDLKSNKSIKISSLSPYEVQGLFAIDEDNLEDSLAKRKEILKKRGITGTAILDMEREVDGVRKIPLYSDDMYRGFIGAKTGSTEEFRSLSNLDRSTKNIVQELTSPLPDEDRLLNKVKRQKKEHKNMVNSLQKGALAGKVTGGNAGIIDSADEGLDVYADWMAQKHGTKSALDNVATMSDKNFIKEFGQDEYDNVKKTLKEAGISKIGKGTDLSGLKKDVSDAWSMVNRFPDEGNTEMAMNFLPQSAVEGEMIEDSIGVTTRTGKNGITTLSATHGDLDGDMLYSKGAQSRAAKDEIKELAFGNKGQSVAYRKAAMERGKKLIKGKAKKDMRFIPVKERREASILAKYSEKEDISRISDEMQRVRVANIAEGLDSASSYDSKRTLAVANATTFYSENSLKAKHWSTEQLRKKKAIDSIDALKGTNAYERVPIAERKQVFTNYVDELMLGGDAKHANALRAKTVAESTFIEMEKQGFLDARKVHKSGWFQESMSNQVVDDIFNMSKKSDGMGRIVKTAGEMAAEGVGSNAYELNKKKKQLENLGEGAAGFLKKFGGKIGKYAIAPAFAIGAVGSIFGGTGEIKAKEVGGDQYSDGQKRHYGGGHSQQELISAPQMKRPRYENTRIQGGAVASQMNFSQLSGDSKVTLTDNTRNFESHDIQEIIDKGY
jgi:preprotein translocase subunit YajC